MKVEFLKSFSKDLDRITSATIKSQLVKLIDTIEQSEDFKQIANTKKLKGHRNAFRIRIGDYRLGLFLEHETVLMARILHRKDIYKIFP